ncbi:MAG: CopG family antitoxin [Patescibacteria group bacterium]
MKKKKISKIPIFKNYEDEAIFWDTHSFVDFEDETKDVDIVFELHKPAEETLILRIQKSLKNQLAKIAKKKGVSVSSLSRMWLTEKARASGA